MTNQETTPSILVIGVEDGTRAARTVRAELKRFGLGSFRFGSSEGNPPPGSWLLLLGRDIWTSLSSPGQRGAIGDYGQGCFALPTHHPEYVRRRPSLLKQWRRDLETFVTFAKLDLYGVVD